MSITEQPLALGLLFAGPPQLDAGELTSALRAGSSELADAVVELERNEQLGGAVLGLARWGDHALRFVTFEGPMPSEAVESCLAPAHFAAERKQLARAHTHHAVLYHICENPEPLERFVALTVLASVLARHNGLVILNESGCTSVPAEMFAPARASGEWLVWLRAMPPLVLHAGFVKYNIPNRPEVWMRTHGCHLLGLPDFSMLTSGHSQGQWTFELFNALLAHLRNTNSKFTVGHTVRVGSSPRIRLRHPREDEPFLRSEGEMFVCEPDNPNPR